jgi:hypothetical protein
MYKSFCLRQQRGEIDLSGRNELSFDDGTA